MASVRMAPTAALSLGFEFNPQARLEAPAMPGPRTGTAAEGRQLRQGLRIGDMHLMVRYEDGTELTEIPPMYRLPNAPAWFLGMTNLHGALVPVFDPAEILGVPHASGEKPMLLVLGHGEHRAGLVIDGLPARLRLTVENRLNQGTEPQGLAGCIAAFHHIDGLDRMDFRYAVLFDRLEQELAS